MTSSDPSGSVRMILSGTDFAPFLTRQARWAPRAENRRKRSMEKKPRSARLSMPGPNDFLQLVSQGVLAVVVAADRGADPAEGRGPDVGGDPQQRFRAVSGGAELACQHVVARELHGGAVDGGDLQLLPQQADAEVGVGDGGVQLEQPLHDQLAEQLAGLRERRPGRDCPCPA